MGPGIANYPKGEKAVSSNAGISDIEKCRIEEAKKVVKGGKKCGSVGGTEEVGSK